MKDTFIQLTRKDGKPLFLSVTMEVLAIEEQAEQTQITVGSAGTTFWLNFWVKESAEEIFNKYGKFYNIEKPKAGDIV